VHPLPLLIFCAAHEERDS